MSGTEGEWPRIAVMGAGAVGCYFGGMLARAGVPITLIGRAQHVSAIQRDGLFIDSIHFQERTAIAASTEASAVRGADVVLFCVKTLDTETAATALIPHLSPEAVVVSLQNGVDNVERIRASTNIDAMPSVVYVGASMPAPGRVKHVARGELIVGELPGRDTRRQWDCDAVAGLFSRADVPCRVSGNIEGELWTKLIMNCAYNAISAIAQADYERLARSPETREVVRKVVEEAVAVANAAGIQLPSTDMVGAAFKLGESVGRAVSSTAQDIARGKRTEMDSLNGYIVRRGTELGVPAPVNQTLHALVKLIEQSAAAPVTAKSAS
jgi:2-dehydropantoate 2-reductase